MFDYWIWNATENLYTVIISFLKPGLEGKLCILILENVHFLTFASLNLTQMETSQRMQSPKISLHEKNTWTPAASCVSFKNKGSLVS
jgi:hypothetical protein